MVEVAGEQAALVAAQRVEERQPVVLLVQAVLVRVRLPEEQAAGPA